MTKPEDDPFYRLFLDAEDKLVQPKIRSQASFNRCIAQQRAQNTESAKAKQRAALSGRILSDAHRAKIGKAHANKHVSEESRAKLRKPKSEQTKQALRLAAQKRDNTNLAKSNTLLKKDVPLSEAHKNRIRAANLKPERIELSSAVAKRQVTCPHCNKQGAHMIMKRWHFDNCKKKAA